MKKIDKILYLIIIITFGLMTISIIHPFLSPMVESNSNGCSQTIGKIDQDIIIEQFFVSELDNLDSIGISYANYMQKIDKGILTAEIFDNENNKIYLNKYFLSELEDNQQIKFEFDIQENVKTKKFLLRLTIDDLEKDKYISFYSSNGNLKLTTDAEVAASGTILITQYGETHNSFFTFVFTIMWLIEIFLLSLMKLKKFTIKIDNKKKKIIYFTMLFVFSILMALTLLDINMDIYYEDRLSLISYPLFLLSSTLLIINVARIISIKKVKLEHLFLALAVPLGCLYLISVLPGNVPDEGFHYQMSYQNAIGNFDLINGEIPKIGKTTYTNYHDVIDNFKGDVIESDEVVSITNFGYSPILYIASGFGIFIGKILNLTVLQTQYLGRLCNFIMFLLGGYFIIKSLPFGKYLGLVYLLSPMILQQSASLSCDVAINMSCLLFIAKILNIKFDKKDFKIKDIFILLTLLVIIFVSKFAYFPLMFLLILIKDKLSKIDNKTKKFTKWGLIIVAIIFLLSFIHIKILPSLVSKTVTTNVIGPQHIYSKFQYLMLNPFKIVYIVFNTLYTYADFYLLTFLGHSLGSFNINMPIHISIMYISILILSVYFDSDKNKLTKKDKILVGIIWLVNFAVICAGLYFGWGNTRDFIVQGVQGRYFIPIHLLILLIISSNKVKFKIENKELIISIILILVNVITVITVIGYFL